MTETVHPLRVAVLAAAHRHAIAAAWLDAVCDDDSIDAEDPRYLSVADLEASSSLAVDSAVQALRDSDCPREWRLIEDGCHYDTVTATSAEEALDIARSNVDRAHYSECEGTLYVEARVYCEETDESDSDTVTLDEEEPECCHEDGHDWQSPYEIVGGIRDNPGVWGHGGGVLITECCMHCGCARTTDTWAQNPQTGEQGLREVSYEPERFADEIAAVEVAS
jgi:hypothetical protein